MKKRILCFIMFVICSLFGVGCVGASNDNISEKMENLQIKIPGLQKEYRAIYLCDLHIISDINEVSEDNLATVEARKASMVNLDGESADSYWPKLADKINKYDADIVLLGGDMLDYMSSSNVACLKEGMERIDAPVMYVRADHDYANWYQEDLTQETIDELSKTIDSNEEVFVKEIGELLFIGINNTTSQISASALAKVEDILKNNDKPIIVTTHVPIQSTLNDELDKLSKAVWQDRSLIWGNDCYYVPDQNTSQFIDLIENENSNVVAILSGHLHFPYHGKTTADIMQHVFGAAYEGNIAEIVISN